MTPPTPRSTAARECDWLGRRCLRGSDSGASRGTVLTITNSGEVAVGRAVGRNHGRVVASWVSKWPARSIGAPTFYGRMRCGRTH